MSDSSVFPVVSVILPTCRRPQFLRRAIRSVVSQEYSFFELIIVDDSPDEPAEAIVGEFHDARIRYVRHEANRGASAARNTGFRSARGCFIAFLDDDDEWLPYYLERAVAVFTRQTDKVGVLACGSEIVDEQGHRISVNRPRQEGFLYREVLRGEKPTGILALVRKECLERCGGFDEDLPSCQDWDLWLRVCRKYDFAVLPDIVARVHAHGERISSSLTLTLAGRERILEKYRAEFVADGKAIQIHLKRLGKMHALNGSWDKAWRYFAEAVRRQPLELCKIMAWLAFEYLLLKQRWAIAVVVASLSVAFYSQWKLLGNPWVINDDVCQHIWWMRSFRDSALFPADLLYSYAVSLQNFGILFFYRLGSLVADPVAIARMLVFVMIPLTAFFLFRLAVVIVKDDKTAFLVTLAMLVTPLYSQHMTGGHAHVFGFPLFVMFLYFLMTGRQRPAAWTLITQVLFFPVIFAVSALTWALLFFMPIPPGGFFPDRKTATKQLVFAVLTGILILSLKFFVFADPVLGKVLAREQVSRMPELTDAGRWNVWPVEPLWRAVINSMENGFYIFTVFKKALLSEFLKRFLVDGHGLMLFLAGSALVWWWRKRRESFVAVLASAMLASILLYVIAGAVILRFYAPDRYLTYSLAVGALLFFMIPIGSAIFSFGGKYFHRISFVAAFLAILAALPLTRNAGLKDYSEYRHLYAFLGTLPKTSLIAAYPEIADGIPLFSRRSVLVNAELSVPLFDSYWEIIKIRTRDLFQCYYAQDSGVVRDIGRRYGISHLVIDRRHFTEAFLNGQVYFEPFGAEIRGQVRQRSGYFVLANLPFSACVFHEGDLCVVSVFALESLPRDKGL